jgi:hypothetical protein
MTTAVPIVDDADGITAHWLTTALQGAGVDATVGSVCVVPVGAGQMASCYRLDIAYERGDGPPRLIAKLPSTDLTVRAGQAMTYRTEVSFYRDLAPGLSISVPRCYVAAITDEGTSFTLLLEDMAPAVAGDQLAGCSPDDARRAAVEVAGLHAGSWCDPALESLDWLIPPTSAFVEHMGPMLQGAVESFLARRDLDVATTEVLRRFVEGFTEWVAGSSTPWSLLHNDYRLDNLLFAPPDAGVPPVTTVDWQSLSTGAPLQDVGFLLGTGLQPDDRRTHERAIVGEYHDRLTDLGVTSYGADRCWDDYRRGLLHGPLICLLGDAVAAPTERGLRMFSVMAQRSAAAIVDLESFELLDR